MISCCCSPSYHTLDTPSYPYHLHQSFRRILADFPPTFPSFPSSTMSTDAGDAANSLLTSYTEKMSSVAPASVGIQLGLMAAASLGALCAFSILRPTNSLIYQPKVKYAADEKRPPKIGKGLFDWVGPVWHTKEAEMMDTIGLDAVAYLRFLRMVRNSTSGSPQSFHSSARRWLPLRPFCPTWRFD